MEPTRDDAVSEPTSQLDFVVPEGVQQARAAFLRDFAKLMADRKTRGKYVCYHKDQLIAVNKDDVPLIRELVARNIPENESLIFKVTPGAEYLERIIAEEGEFS
jgi:hypothetical protein